jgi:alpha-galactosidase
VPDPAKWPNGIKAVTDQIHGMGLKFGLYGCAGTKTCAGYPGSQGYEVKDAQTLASWGVDYWKHDNCYTPCTTSPVPQTCSSPAGSTQTWYAKMRDALLSVNKPIFFSMCQWGRDNVWTWGADYGNSWRMSTDIWNDWASVVRIGSAAAGMSQYAAPGGFNDLDMMVCFSSGLLSTNLNRNVANWQRGAHSGRGTDALRDMGHCKISHHPWHRSLQDLEHFVGDNQEQGPYRAHAAISSGR